LQGVNLVKRRRKVLEEVPTHIGISRRRESDIGIPVDRRSGKSTLKILTQIWVVHLREDVCHVIVHFGDPSTRHRDIGAREIGVPEVVKVGTSEVSKTRGVIRTIHQRRTRGSNRSHRGKARQEVVYRHFGHRDIGNPGDKRFGHFRIAKSETPTRKEAPSWGQLSAYQIRKKALLCGGQLSAYPDSEDRESREPMHCGIEKLETLTSGKTAVTGITVIWARSLARRASA
jgi:hypothetical protein